MKPNKIIFSSFTPIILTISLFISSCNAATPLQQGNASQPIATLEQKQKIEVCFTPPRGCAKHILNQINAAQEEIYVQAYSFTSKEIAEALVKAHQRGVKLHIMFDRTSTTSRGTKTHILKENGIDYIICKVPGIAHNKVMVIDKKTIITGSYNFTTAADFRNAENLLIIEDTKLAQNYIDNWINLSKRS
jgi:phospholipase D